MWQGICICYPENSSLILGSLFRADYVGTNHFNLQKGYNRRQWDPGIPCRNKDINTVQVRNKLEQTLHDGEWISTTSWVQLCRGHSATKWTGLSLYKDREELVTDPEKNHSQLSGFPICWEPIALNVQVSEDTWIQMVCLEGIASILLNC